MLTVCLKVQKQRVSLIVERAREEVRKCSAIRDRRGRGEYSPVVKINRLKVGIHTCRGEGRKRVSHGFTSREAFGGQL